MGVLGAALVWAAPARADDGQLLVTHSGSLTSMQLAAPTSVQNALPHVLHRGVNLDGSTRAGSAFGWRLNANPIGGGTVGGRTLNEIDLVTGSPVVTAIDLSLPAKQPWAVGRSYSARQDDGGHHDSDGYQGRNWFQMSQPELVFEDEAADADDLMYLVYGADRYIEFRRVALAAGGYSSTEFRAVNGAAGVLSLDRDSGTGPDTWTYHDQAGNTAVFFGFDDDSGGSSPDAGVCTGQLWKVSDPAGNTAYVGDSSTISTAISSGYDGSGRILKAYDSVGRRYCYTYSTLDSVTRLTQVICETDAGGGWGGCGTETMVGKVEYGYYQTGDNTYGDNGCLGLVTVTTPLSDSGVNLVAKTYFRYWKGSFDDTTNPGHQYALQYIVAAEGYRQADWADADLTDNDPQSMTETNLKPYASSYFEYNSTRQVDKAWFNGECGCSGGSNGTHELTYETDDSYSDTSGYQTVWAHRTVVERPDGTFVTQYFDEVGQPLSEVTTDGDPAVSYTDLWATKVVRDSGGRVTHVHTPANENGYTHDVSGNPDGTLTPGSSGLVHIFERLSSGDRTGLVRNRKWTDDNSTNVYFGETTVTTQLSETIGNATLNRPRGDSAWSYFTKVTTETAPPAGEEVDVVEVAFSGMLVPEYTEHEQRTVSTGTNGSGLEEATVAHYNSDGTVEFTRSVTGIIGYRKYNSFGLVETSVADADTTQNGAGQIFNGVTIPTAPTDPYDFNKRGTPLHDVTSYTYDAQGRSDTVTAPDGRVSKRYYTKLADGRMVTISIPKYVSGTGTFHGPASYSVANLAGKAEFSGTIALSTTVTALTSWIDETKSDEIEALGVGSLSGVSVSVYDESGGRLEESRMYFDLPGSPSFLPGTEGTHYDATTFGYDDMGRKWRVEDPTGTISRTVFDDLGRGIESWIGTNDSSFAGGEPSGTDNMVKTAVREYDGGSDGGNSHLTEVTRDADGNWGGATDQRVTSYLHDARGRVIVTIGPQAPHSLAKYDEQGNLTASAMYSSGSGLDAADDPTSLATNRLSLSTTLHDLRGRAYQARQYQINQSTGAIVQETSNDVYLRTQTWYDPEGRVMKTQSSITSKTRYDRLGRPTHRWTIADDDDTSYGHATASTAVWDSDDYVTTAAGDIVVEESQTVYEADTGNVIMAASIERDFADRDTGETTGPLDTNADAEDDQFTAANLEGRIQITAMWYDELDRLEDTAQYGTNGGGDYDRSDHASPPSRSDTELRTTITYNDDGTRQQVEDPEAVKTRWLYDDAQRVVATISNYVDGTPTGATGADDNYVRQVYTNGLQAKLWVDLDGDNAVDADDQETFYIYGSNAGTPTQMKLTTGHLLRAVVYPDSTNAGTTLAAIDSDSSDVASFAYNALGEQVYAKDPAGTVIETDYDTGGRQTQRRATTTGSGIDTAVLRISTAYTTRGQIETVTQYDNAAAGSGSVVDEVKYSYDEWGNVTTFDQDWNSVVNGGDDRDVDYSYALARSQGSGVYLALRGTGMTLPNGASVTYTYDSTDGRHDDELGRVSRVQVGATSVARYEYNGLASLVGTEYLEADLLYTRYNTSGSFDRLDSFNRVEDDIWTRGIDNDVNPGYDVYRDFYDVDITWSRSSNIDLVEDNVYPGWDVAYTNDGLERLAQAKRGTWNGSSITTPLHDEQWTLSQTGNWEVYKLDLNADGVLTGTNELDDDQTFNLVNELTARDTDDNGTNNYTLTYDAAGNLTDDDKDYEFVYDAWGRLRKVNNQSQALVAEYTYNGLGYRTGWHYDVDGDGTVEANSVSNTEDPWFQFVYDARWRVTATYRASRYSTWTIDAADRVKEQFVYHNAGLDGSGGSSYIDEVILRDRDANTDWANQADGTLEERVYYCQNWRADVVALMTSAGALINQVRYDPYGVPFGIAKTDLDADGDVDNADATLFATYHGAATMPFADWNWDGTKDLSDQSAYTADKNSDAGLGRGVPAYATWSHAGAANRKLYAGYEIDPILTGSEGWQSVYHVRHRVYLSQLGRWTRRDPLGYVQQLNLLNAVASTPIVYVDPLGLVGGLPDRLADGSCNPDPCHPLCDHRWGPIPILQGPSDNCSTCIQRRDSGVRWASSGHYRLQGLGPVGIFGGGDKLRTTRMNHLHLQVWGEATNNNVAVRAKSHYWTYKTNDLFAWEEFFLGDIDSGDLSYKTSCTNSDPPELLLTETSDPTRHSSGWLRLLPGSNPIDAKVEFKPIIITPRLSNGRPDVSCKILQVTVTAEMAQWEGGKNHTSEDLPGIPIPTGRRGWVGHALASATVSWEWCCESCEVY